MKPEDYDTKKECEKVGYNWCDDSCHSEPKYKKEKPVEMKKEEKQKRKIRKKNQPTKKENTNIKIVKFYNRFYRNFL